MTAFLSGISLHFGLFVVRHGFIFMESYWTQVKIVIASVKAYLVTILEELLMIYLSKGDN